MLANAAPGEGTAFEGALLRGGLAELADLPGVISAEVLTLADQQIRGSAKKYAYAVLLELHDHSEALPSLADGLPRLQHLDRERWIAVVFRPIGHRLTTSEARSARAEHG
jgi:anti-sigma factor ChrR (cupin superfamily)